MSIEQQPVNLDHVVKTIERIRDQRDDARKQVKHLQQHAHQWEKRVKRHDDEIANLEKRLRDSLKPAEPTTYTDRPTVIRFSKTYGDNPTRYNYAAIRSGNGLCQWAITQTTSAHSPQPMLTWDGLLNFMGSGNWPTIELMTGAINANRPWDTLEYAEYRRAQGLQAYAFANGIF
jgi:hypothetical protein